MKILLSVFILFVSINGHAQSQSFIRWVKNHQSDLSNGQPIYYQDYNFALKLAIQNLKKWKSCAINWDYKLSNDEAVALILYAGNGYSFINKVLWSGRPKDIESIKPFTSVLSSALSKIPNQQATQFRYTSIPEDVLSTYRKGDVITFKGYTSTSGDPDWKFTGASFGDVFMTIHSSAVNWTACYSQRSYEREGLIDKNARFLIEDISSDGKELVLKQVFKN